MKRLAVLVAWLTWFLAPTPLHAQRVEETADVAYGLDATVLTLEGAGHAIFPSITPKARDATLDF